MDATLAIKITALVEGLQQVAELGKTLIDTGDSAKALAGAKPFDGLGPSAAAAGSSIDSLKSKADSLIKTAENVKLGLVDAFSVLGGRTTDEIQQEVLKVQQALEGIRKSSIGLLDVQKNVDAATQSLAGLKASAQGVTTSFAVVGQSAEGLAALKTVEDELSAKALAFDNALQKASASMVVLGTSGASFKDVVKAQQDAEAATKELESSIKGLDSLFAGLKNAGVPFEQMWQAEKLANLSLTEMRQQLIALDGALGQIKNTPEFDDLAKAEALALANLQRLEQEMKASGLGQEFKAIGAEAVATAMQMGEQFSALYGKTLPQLEAEIDQVVQALQTVKDSGAGFEAVARAEELATTRLKALQAELESKKAQLGYQGLQEAGERAAQKIDAAFQALGGRSTRQVQAQIQEVQATLESLRKSATLSAEDLSRAEDLAAAKIRQLNAELEQPAPLTFSQRLSKIKDSLQEADFAGAVKELNGLNIGLEGLSFTLGKVLTGFLAIKAIKFLGEMVGDVVAFAKESAQLAARVETLGVTLGAVGRNAGYSADELARAEAGVKKMGITSEAARDSLVKMIQAGIKINEVGSTIGDAGERLTRAQELSRAAQDLAVVSGENSSQTLQRMITNIQQMDTQGLRFMGLTVSRQAAEAEFAASVGKSASALTESEKKQAFLNATIKEAQKLAGTYESALETVGKQLASLKRYQDEYAKSFGDLLLPAYGEVVKAQTKFYDQSQQIVEQFKATSAAAEYFKSAVQSIATAVSSILVEGVKEGLGVFEAFTRVLKGVADLVGPVIDSFNGIVLVINKIGEAVGIDNLTTKLNPLSVMLNGISVILAVVKDSIVLAFGLGVQVGSAFADVLGTIIQGVGVVAKVVNKDLGQSILDFGSSMRETSKSTEAWGQDMVKNVLTGKGAVGDLANSFMGVDKNVKASNATFKELSAEIAAVAAAQREGRISSQGLSNAYEYLRNKMQEAADAGEISTKGIGKQASELAQLNKQLTAIPGTIGNAYSEAAAAAGTSIGQLRTQISNEMATGVSFVEQLIAVAASKLDKIAHDAGSSVVDIGNDVLRAFEHYTDMAKNLNELALLEGKVSDAFQKGVLRVDQYQEALGQAAGKFEELLKAGLKTADTTQKLDDLTESVRKLRSEGAITETQYAHALDLIADKATGAKEAVQRLATQTRELADESVKIETARFDLVKAETDVLKSRASVWVAENKYAMTGNDLDALGVEIAKLDLAVAEQQLALARIKYKEQQDNYDLALAKQRLLNAETALQYDRGNAALQGAAIAAQAVVDKQTVQLENTKTQVDLQVEQLLKTQEMQYAAKGVYDVLKMQEQSYKEMNAQVSGVAYGTANLTKATKEWNKEVGDGHTTLGLLTGTTTNLAQNFGTMQQRVAGVGQGAVSLRDNLGAMGSRLGELNSQTNTWGLSLGRTQEQARGVGQGFSLISTNADQVSKNLDGLDPAMQGLLSTSTDIGSSWRSTGESIGTADGAIIGVAGDMNLVSTAADKVLGGTKSINDMLGTTSSLMKGLTGTTNEWLAAITSGVSKSLQALNNLDQARRSLMETITGLNYGAGSGVAGSGLSGISSSAPGAKGSNLPSTNDLMSDFQSGAYDQNGIRKGNYGSQLTPPDNSPGWVFDVRAWQQAGSPVFADDKQDDRFWKRAPKDIPQVPKGGATTNPFGGKAGSPYWGSPSFSDPVPPSEVGTGSAGVSSSNVGVGSAGTPAPTPTVTPNSATPISTKTITVQLIAGSKQLEATIDQSKEQDLVTFFQQLGILKSATG